MFCVSGDIWMQLLGCDVDAVHEVQTGCTEHSCVSLYAFAPNLPVGSALWQEKDEVEVALEVYGEFLMVDRCILRFLYDQFPILC